MIRILPLNIVKMLIMIQAAMFLVACSEDSSSSKPEAKKKKAKTHLVETYAVRLHTKGLQRQRTGTLRAQREVKIFNQEEGQLTQLPYFEGEKFKKGAVIARLDDALLKAQLARAVASRKKAQSDLKRIKGLRQQDFSSEEELARVSTELAVAEADELLLKTRLSHTKIKAPFSGVLTKRLVEVGNVAERYTHLLTIADLSTLNSEVSISDILLSKIKLNDTVSVRIDALGNQSFPGRISRIHPSIDPQTRRGIIEIELNPVPKGARPGQMARVTLSTHVGEYLLIPFRAIRVDDESSFVYVVDTENKIQRRNVNTGLRLEDLVQIKSGLNEGEQVVTKGFLGLKENKKVKIVFPTNITQEQEAQNEQ